MHAFAYEVTVDSITYSGATDADADGIADDLTVMDTPSNPPEGEAVTEDTFGVSYDEALVGTDMTMVFTIDTPNAAPIVLVSGGIIASYTWDETNSQGTTTWEAGQFIIPGDTEASNESAFAIIDPGTEDPSPDSPDHMGPPASMAGGYISVDITDWEMSPPEDETQAFGLSMTGAEGTTGYFQMYMPPTMLALMSTMTGETITVDDLAIAVDGFQSNITTTETADGGVFFDIDVTFETGSTATSASAMNVGPYSSDTITKTVMAQTQADISTAFKKKTVEKTKNAKLYGWIKDAKKGKTVKIYRKKKGKKKYKKIKTVKTKNSNGYYYYKFKPKKSGIKTGTFYYKVKNKKRTKISSQATLKVTK